MINHNLNDNVEEYFDFSLGGYTYRMRYPLIEELEEIEIMRTKVSESQDQQTLETINQKFYSFITPLTEDAPSIDKVMKSQSIRVMRNFMNMIREEISLD